MTNQPSLAVEGPLDATVRLLGGTMDRYQIDRALEALIGQAALAQYHQQVIAEDRESGEWWAAVEQQSAKDMQTLVLTISSRDSAVGIAALTNPAGDWGSGADKFVALQDLAQQLVDDFDGDEGHKAWLKTLADGLRAAAACLEKPNARLSG